VCGWEGGAGRGRGAYEVAQEDVHEPLCGASCARRPLIVISHRVIDPPPLCTRGHCFALLSAACAKSACAYNGGKDEAVHGNHTLGTNASTLTAATGTRTHGHGERQSGGCVLLAVGNGGSGGGRCWGRLALEDEVEQADDADEGEACT
jgi:hypothetical protein